MNTTMDIETAIQTYINTFDESEKIAFKIAVDNLESSFDIVKSIGFKQFIKKNEIIIKN